jgi:predicted nucleic acid-binding protein
MRYVLDACAMLARLNKEPEADTVDGLINQCATGEIELFMSAVQVVEVYYNWMHVRGHEAADDFLEKTYASHLQIIDTLPKPVVRMAGRLKVSYSISLADAFACATAMSLGAALVTKDHEIETVEQNETLSVFWIDLDQ